MSLSLDQFSLFVYSVSALALIYSLVELARLFFIPKASESLIPQLSLLFWSGVKMFLIRQLSIIAVASVVVSSILYQILNLESAIGFLLGSLASALVASVAFLISSFTLFWGFRDSRRHPQSPANLLTQVSKFVSLFSYAVILGSLYGFDQYTRDPKALISLGLGVSWVALFSCASGLLFSRGTILGREVYSRELSIFGESSHSLAETAASQFAGVIRFYELVSLGVIGTLLLGEKTVQTSLYSHLSFGLLALGVLAWIAASSIQFRLKFFNRSFIASVSLFLILVFITIKNIGFNSGQLVPALKVVGSSSLVFLVAVMFPYYFVSQRFAPFNRLLRYADESPLLSEVYLYSLSRGLYLLPIALIILLLLVSSGLMGLLGVAVVVVVFVALSPMALFSQSAGTVFARSFDLGREAKMTRKTRQEMGQMGGVSAHFNLTGQTFVLVMPMLLLLLFLTLVPFDYGRVLFSAVWSRLLVSALAGLFLTNWFISLILSTLVRNVWQSGRLFNTRGRRSEQLLIRLRQSYLSRLLKDSYLVMLPIFLCLVVVVGAVGFLFGDNGLFGLVLGMLVLGLTALPTLSLDRQLSSHLIKVRAGKDSRVSREGKALEVRLSLTTESIFMAKTAAVSFIGVLCLLMAYFLG